MKNLKMPNNLALNNSDLQALEKKGEELEWFLKRIAIEAVDKNNKEEFLKILTSNDSMAFALFIKKYVPDFKNKLETFIEGGTYA